MRYNIQYLLTCLTAVNILVISYTETVTEGIVFLYDDVHPLLGVARVGVFYDYRFPNNLFVDAYADNTIFLNGTIGQDCGLVFVDGPLGSAGILGRIDELYTCGYNSSVDGPHLDVTIIAYTKDGRQFPSLSRDLQVRNESNTGTNSSQCVFQLGAGGNWNDNIAWPASVPPSMSDIVVLASGILNGVWTTVIGPTVYNGTAEGEDQAVAGALVLEWNDTQNAPHIIVQDGGSLGIFGVSGGNVDCFTAPFPSATATPSPRAPFLSASPSFLTSPSSLPSQSSLPSPSPSVTPTISSSPAPIVGDTIQVKQAGTLLSDTESLQLTSTVDCDEVIVDVHVEPAGAPWSILAEGRWISAYAVNSSLGNAPARIRACPLGLDPGTYSTVVSFLLVGRTAAQYRSSVLVSFKVLAPVMDVTPSIVDIVVPYGRNGSTTMVVANNGQANLTASVSIVGGSTWASFSRVGYATGSASPSTFTDISHATSASIFVQPGQHAVIGLLAMVANLNGTLETNILVSPSATLHPSLSPDDVLWRVRVARMTVCPESIETTIEPSSTMPFSIGVSNLDVHDIDVMVDTSQSAPWLNVRSFPNRIPPGAVPESIIVAALYNPLLISSESDLTTSFDVIASGSSTSSVERRQISVTLRPLTGEASYTTSSLFLQTSQNGGSVIADAKISLRDGVNRLMQLAGTIPSALGVSAVMISDSNYYQIMEQRMVFTTPDDTLGVVRIEIRPQRVGTIQLNVTLGGQHIQGSPAFATVARAVCSNTTEESETRLDCVCRPGFELELMDGGDGEMVLANECTPCKQGYFKPRAGNDSCIMCGSNQFSWEQATECIECPDNGALCSEGQLYLLDGYWRESSIAYTDISSNTMLHACPASDACTLNDTTKFVDCSEGFHGVFCAVCSSGYAKNGDVCSLCDRKALNIAVTTIFFIALIGAVVFVALKKKDQSDPKTSPASLFRIMLNWLQASAMIGNFYIQASGGVRDFLKIGDAANGGSVLSLQPVQCVLGFTYFERFYVIYSIPVLAVVVPLIVAGILNWYSRSKRSTSDSKSSNPVESKSTNYFNTATAATVALLFLCYPTVLKFIISAWDYYPYPVEGKTYLRTDYSVNTANPQYKIVLFLSFIGLFVYIVGIPALAFKMLVANRNRLSDISVRRRLGFLYEGYHRTKTIYFTWETIVLLRKTALTLVAVLFTDPLLQLSVGVFVIFVALVLHVSVHPFQSRTANRLELGSLCVLLSTAVAALFNYSTPVQRNVTVSLVIAGIIFAANVAMALAFIFSLIVRSSKKIAILWTAGLTSARKKTKRWRDAARGHLLTEDINDVLTRLCKGEKTQAEQVLQAFRGHSPALEQLLADKKSLPSHARKALSFAMQELRKEQREEEAKELAEKNGRGRRPSLELMTSAAVANPLNAVMGSPSGRAIAPLNPLKMNFAAVPSTADARVKARMRWAKIRVYVRMFGAMGILNLGRQRAMEREAQVDSVLQAAGTRLEERRSVFMPEANRRTARRSRMTRPRRSIMQPSGGIITQSPLAALQARKPDL